MGASEVSMLQQYWLEEPWGPWRDNLHAAIIAREIRSGNYKGKHEIKDFMIVSPERRDQAAQKKGVFDFFKSIAKRKPLPKESK